MLKKLKNLSVLARRKRFASSVLKRLSISTIKTLVASEKIFLNVPKYFPVESQVLVQNINVSLQSLLNVQESWH